MEHRHAPRAIVRVARLGAPGELAARYVGVTEHLAQMERASKMDGLGVTRGTAPGLALTLTLTLALSLALTLTLTLALALALALTLTLTRQGAELPVAQLAGVRDARVTVPLPAYLPTHSPSPTYPHAP